MMDKGKRAQVKKQKFKNRLKRLGLKPEHPRDYSGYRNSSTPCSCGICSFKKYDRAKVKFTILTKEEVEAGRIPAYEYIM